MFSVGMKVVCIDGGPSTLAGRFIRQGVRLAFVHPCPLLREGEIYTVREVTISHLSGVPAIKLCEITNRPYGDDPYRASRFRPIVSRKTSIEIFTKILTPKRVDA